MCIFVDEILFLTERKYTQNPWDRVTAPPKNAPPSLLAKADKRGGGP